MLAAQPMAAQQNALETASALPPPDSEAAAAGDVGHPTHALIEPPTILLTTEEGPSLASICAAAAAAEDYTCCGSRECTCFRCTGVALPQDYLVFPCPLQRISFRPDYLLPDPGEEGPAMLMTHHEAICAPWHDTAWARAQQASQPDPQPRSPAESGMRDWKVEDAIAALEELDRRYTFDFEGLLLTY